ncbi:hypothetical protein [Solitalea canadensis]|uniref:Uncharacterized protein n=1 Tax=Solitalea canadensis (strain ATCC 29591 / DSM 3403 / JCM 21819 / LMG 8368 / NBRC 15130 / NCIMB 12057 / USAM 9D) TaxID=929556 RepID=H8KVU8_SOLCM|nr:hypothetical protein [Solitalea canadensis]AFD06721.1 hypothetical protein Solca_1655 [Solitalea canadensis DSM 3403]
MKRLFIQLGIIVIVFAATDWFIGRYFDSKIVKTNCGYYKKVKDYFMTDKKYDIIIYGNSRALHQYVPAVFAEQLNKNAFNAGMEAAGIYYYNVLIKHSLRNHQTRLMIIDINNRELESSLVGDKTNAERFLVPFFNIIPESKESLQLTLSDQICYTSNLYRYNTKFYNIFRNNNMRCRDIDCNGYEPLYGRGKRNARLYYSNTEPVDNERVALINSIIAECKANNVKLIFVFSPKQFDDRKTESRAILNAIFEKNNIPVFDFTNHSSFRDKNLFYDDAHLNHKGAVLYSKLLTQKIKEQELTAHKQL